MAEAETQSDQQCNALTSDGSQCSRPARDDGFCYQHDEDDPTVNQTTSATESDEPSSTEDEPDQTETTGPEDVDASDVDVDIDVDVDESSIESILKIRRTVESTAGQLIGRKLDGVSEISGTEDGWQAVVEVVERSAIPDTQDILGSYRIDLSEDGTVEGYHRLGRYHRDDTSEKPT